MTMRSVTQSLPLDSIILSKGLSVGFNIPDRPRKLASFSFYYFGRFPGWWCFRMDLQPLPEKGSVGRWGKPRRWWNFAPNVGYLLYSSSAAADWNLIDKWATRCAPWSNCGQCLTDRTRRIHQSISMGKPHRRSRWQRTEIFIGCYALVSSQCYSGRFTSLSLGLIVASESIFHSTSDRRVAVTQIPSHSSATDKRKLKNYLRVTTSAQHAVDK